MKCKFLWSWSYRPAVLLQIVYYDLWSPPEAWLQWCQMSTIICQLQQLVEGSCQSYNYFNKALHLQDNDQAFHPSIHSATLTSHSILITTQVSCTINGTGEKFGIPDLHPDFVLYFGQDNLVNYVIDGQWGGVANTDLNLKSDLVCICKQSHAFSAHQCMPTLS